MRYSCNSSSTVIKASRDPGLHLSYCSSPVCVFVTVPVKLPHLHPQHPKLALTVIAAIYIALYV